MRLLARRKNQVNLSVADEIIFGFCVRLDKTIRSTFSSSSIGFWEWV